MSSAKQEDYPRHAAFPAPPPNSGNMVRLSPVSDMYSAHPYHHGQQQQQQPQQQQTPNMSVTQVPDSREWSAPNYRPVRGGQTASESGRYYPYPRAQTSSPPYVVNTHAGHHSQQQQVQAPRSSYSDFSSYSTPTNSTLSSMPELTSSTAVRPDTVASSGPLPFDKEQLLQSSSRSSFLTPPNSAPPCNGSTDEHTPTSSRSTLLASQPSSVDPAASAHLQYRYASPHFAADPNSDNDSGHGDSPYTANMRNTQSHLVGQEVSACS